MKVAAILGYGKSGKGAERILLDMGYSIDIYDDAINDCMPFANYKAGYDLTVVSPGVLLSKLAEQPKKVTSEIELAFNWMPTGSQACFVTGSNGKSTVTTVTAQILNKLGLNAVACGNIGYTFADAVMDAGNEEKIYIVELSSFQIELLDSIEVSAMVLTNLSPNHLDRYSSYDEYVNAKLRLLDFVAPKGLVLSDADTRIVNRTLRGSYNTRFLNIPAGSTLAMGNFSVDLKKYPLFGKHNMINLWYALSLVDFIARPEGDITYTLEGLKGMPHRVELVHDSARVRWYNDSKSTSIASTLAALTGCVYPTILMLGGFDKKSAYHELVDEINRCCYAVCLFGAAADAIESAIADKIQCRYTKDISLHEATKQAKQLAEEVSDATVVIMMSPACSSFDEFNNFEHRGLQFAQYVHDMYSCGVNDD